MNTRMMELSEGRIGYDDDESEGRLALCVPGLGDLRSEYRFLGPHLRDAGFRVATMDVRGLGESSTGWSDHSAAAVGSDIVALLRRIDAGPAVVVGTSMAAAAAVWAAAEAPERVSDIVLIGPFIRDIPVGVVQTVMAAIGLRGPWKVKVWGAVYKKFYGDFPPSDLTEHRSAIERNLSEPGRFRALREMFSASKAACEARVPEVKARSLVVMGTKDPDFKNPADEAEHVAERLGSQVLMIQGVGHYPQVEKPEETARAIVGHVQGRTPVASRRA